MPYPSSGAVTLPHNGRHAPAAVLGSGHEGPQSGLARPSFVPVRPSLKSISTSDRLREGSLLTPLVSKMSGKIQKGRRSVFKEVGLEVEGDASVTQSNTNTSVDTQTLPSPPASPASPAFPASPAPPEARQSPIPKFEGPTTASIVQQLSSKNSSSTDTGTESVHQQHQEKQEQNQQQHRRRFSQQQASLPSDQSWLAKLTRSSTRPRVRSASGAPPQSISGTQRFAMLALLIAVVFPAFTLHTHRSKMDINGADAGPLMRREASPTDICTRWAHQAANVNGTLYIYGGEAKREEGQEEDTWNNFFLTLDLNSDWSVDKPALEGLERPDGPPAVALGYLWQDYNNLFLYGGQFADNPYVDPEPESLWRYSIKDEKWTEFPNPETSDGNFSEPANQPVHRAAEGAGISVPELGLSWYFGGHLDRATTPGWSMHVERVYLNSLLEFTHPGYTNTAVDSLRAGRGAGEGGMFRNITTAGVQADNFPDRADAALVFVPGWGDSGILIGLGGGTNDTFAENLKVLDVYDIHHSEWYRQETTGDAPGVRVNPCTVIASAPDASSFQIYMFGGQNLQPYADQTQYNDMYILSIPAFVWVKVENDDNTPSPRAGHTCHMRDGQMILVGGYVGEDIACDDPGIYVFDASDLTWKDSFSAGDHEPDHHPDNSVLAGSYGYSVPKVIQDEIGGDGDGGATATIPAAGEPSDGPFATGKPPVFTITESGATETVAPTGSPNTGNGDTDDSGSDGSAPGLIAAGVIAGVAGALALYLGFCAWVYRRQVSAYRRHLAVANRYSNTPGGSASMLQRNHSQLRPPPMSSLVARPFALFRTQESPNMGAAHHSDDDESFAWVGSERPASHGLSEPKWTSDDPSPSGGIGGSGTSGDAPKISGETNNRRHSGSGESTEGLLDGQEPSFFNVVMGPRRALRVVNGMD